MHSLGLIALWVLELAVVELDFVFDEQVDDEVDDGLDEGLEDFSLLQDWVVLASFFVGNSIETAWLPFLMRAAFLP